MQFCPFVPSACGPEMAKTANFSKQMNQMNRKKLANFGEFCQFCQNLVNFVDQTANYFEVNFQNFANKVFDFATFYLQVLAALSNNFKILKQHLKLWIEFQ